MGIAALTSQRRTRLLVRSALVSLVVSVGLAWGQAASAATFVPSTGNPGADGGALRTAIINAPPNEVIYIAPGQFSPDTTIDLTKNVTLGGSGGGPTAIDGANLTTPGNQSPFLDAVAVAPGVTATLRNIRFTGVTGSGEALNVVGGTATVENSTFVNT